MNILRLAAKDLWQQRRFALLLFAFEVVSCEVLFIQLPTRVPNAVPVMMVELLGCIASFIFCFRTMVTEEKNRAFLFLKTLPVSDAELVLGKFAANLTLVIGNFAALVAYYALAVRIGHIHRAIEASVGLVLMLLALQVATNFLFLATALVFDSEKAVWVPFPFIWVAVPVIGNLNAIADALGIRAFVDALFRNVALCAVVVLAGAAGLVGVTVVLFHRRRRFG